MKIDENKEWELRKTKGWSREMGGCWGGGQRMLSPKFLSFLCAEQWGAPTRRSMRKGDNERTQRVWLLQMPLVKVVSDDSSRYLRHSFDERANLSFPFFPVEFSLGCDMAFGGAMK